jgi:hypothetical protein
VADVERVAVVRCDVEQAAHQDSLAERGEQDAVNDGERSRARLLDCSTGVGGPRRPPLVSTDSREGSTAANSAPAEAP